MKTFKKVLASALAAAMVVTAFPVTNAEAATKAKLSATKATIYVGQSKTIKVTLPKGAKITSVKTKKAVATVKKSGKKVVVKAVKAGKATVTVKVTPKKGKATNLKATITVKNPTITMKGDAELLIGATTSCKATVKPSTKVAYKSSDDAIATVDANGSVKGVKAGTVTITATAKVGTKTVKATKNIVVKNGITELKAATPKKLTVKFAGALESVAKENFTLTDAKGAKVAIQKATLDETKTIVTIDLYSELTTATKYTVEAKIADATYTESLDFVKGAVAKIVAANQIVKAGTAQKVKYTVYDENGLDITDSTVVSFSSNVGINPTTGELNLTDGVLAYVTITYVNPTTGAEIKSETFTVTGSNSAATTIDAVTVGTATDTGATIAAWPKTATTTVAKNASGLKLFTQYANQYGDKIIATNGTDVSYESLDPTILIVDTKTGALTPIAEGAAQIKVTSGTVSQLFTITVVAPATASKLVLDASSSVLKASMTNSSVNKASVKVNVQDQNGKNFNDDSASNNLTFTLTSGAGVLDEATDVGDTVSATAGVAKTFTAAKAGTATFKVTSNKAGLNYVMVSITVYAVDNTVVKYGLTGIKDLNIQDKYDEDTNTNDYKTTVEVKALNKDGFVVEADEVSGAAITVTKPDKTQKTLESGSDNFDTTDSDFSAVGAYSIVATKNGTTIATATINVKDTGVKPAVTIKKNSIDYTEIKGYSNDILDNFKPETGWEVTGVKFVSGNAAAIASAANTAVTTITRTGSDSVTLYNVVVVVRNLTSNREVDVATNQSITVK